MIIIIIRIIIISLLPPPYHSPPTCLTYFSTFVTSPRHPLPAPDYWRDGRALLTLLCNHGVTLPTPQEPPSPHSAVHTAFMSALKELEVPMILDAEGEL